MEYNEERLELIWNIIMGDRTLESLSIDERCKLGFMQELDNSEPRKKSESSTTTPDKKFVNIYSWLAVVISLSLFVGDSH